MSFITRKKNRDSPKAKKTDSALWNEFTCFLHSNFFCVCFISQMNISDHEASISREIKSFRCLLHLFLIMNFCQRRLFFFNVRQHQPRIFCFQKLRSLDCVLPVADIYAQISILQAQNQHAVAGTAAGIRTFRNGCNAAGHNL